jgi:hypothetical protein
MNKKMGRPKLPAGTARSNVLALKLSAEELEKIQKNVTESGMSQAEWARNKLMEDGTIILRFDCPKCANRFKKLPSSLKSGGTAICPKCGCSFVDKAIVKEVELLAKRLSK